MKVETILLCLALGGLSACGKKDSADSSGAGGGAAAAPTAKPNPQLVTDIGAVNKNLEAKNYDAAIGALATIKSVPKSEADERLYQQQLQQTLNTLGDKAQVDPKAREAYQVLGRMVTGR